MIRRNKITGESKNIRPVAENVTPTPKTGETFRWEWDTPMMLSPHDPGTLLVGANKLFVSHDRGDSWTVISPDLTTGMNRDTVVTMGLKGSDIRISRDDGVSQYPALITIAESPKQAGLYYTGSDDGLVHVSRDGGKNWQNITKNLPGFPAGAWISEVVPSAYDAATVYVTVDNHRANDYTPHIWVSNDFGATFRSIVGGLTGEIARTLTEDQRNRDVLYLGTETGIFLSLDRGTSWERLKSNLPLHRSRRRDHVASARQRHARRDARSCALGSGPSRADTGIRRGAERRRYKLFTVPTALEWKTKDDRNDEFWGHAYFIGENPPNEAVIQYFLKQPASDLKLRISDAAGKLLRELPIPSGKNQSGIQTMCWDMRGEPITAPVDSAAPAPGGGRGAGGGGRGGRGRGGRGGPQAVPGVPQLRCLHRGISRQRTSARFNRTTASFSEAGRGAAAGAAAVSCGGGGLGWSGSSGSFRDLHGRIDVGARSRSTPRPSKVTMLDPDVHFAAGAYEAYTATVNDLHAMQRRGQARRRARSGRLYSQMVGGRRRRLARAAPFPRQ